MGQERYLLINLNLIRMNTTHLISAIRKTAAAVYFSTMDSGAAVFMVLKHFNTTDSDKLLLNALTSLYIDYLRIMNDPQLEICIKSIACGATKTLVDSTTERFQSINAAHDIHQQVVLFRVNSILP